jgi:hypothetical protein
MINVVRAKIAANLANYMNSRGNKSKADSSLSDSRSCINTLEVTPCTHKNRITMPC